MSLGGVIDFPPFRLDPIEAQLWHGKRKLHLQPRPFAFLLYLLRHPGQLITKKELLAAVWQGAVVTNETVRVCAEKIRKALQDNHRPPRFIETVHGRGYRFIGRVVSNLNPSEVQGSKPVLPAPVPRAQVSLVEGFKVQSQQSAIRLPPPLGGNPPAPSVGGQSAINVVGREVELAQLHGWLDKALTGERQIVFVSGEPGIGKSTLLQSFVSQLTASSHILVALGQCSDHHGVEEPYQPVMEALEHLCHQAECQPLISCLRQYAPLWLAQMPSLLNPKQRTALQKEIHSASRERMQREFANFVEALTTDKDDRESAVLVLCLEDLHWSDPSTLDLLVTLARRPQPARFLLLVTYRPVEVLASNHALRSIQPELRAHQQCVELHLAGLSEMAVATYLSQRFRREEEKPGLLQRLTHALYQRTQGNPFLLVTMVNDLIARGVIAHNSGQWMLPTTFEDVTEGVPTTLRQLIEKYLDQLALEDQHILLAASVAGGDFSAALIASVLNAEVEEVDRRCSTLVRHQQFLQSASIDVRPNRRRLDRFTFRHALSREVCFDRLTTGQQRQLHRQIGLWKEVAYGPRATKLAAELALHFDQGHDHERALPYYQQAAETAVRRYAPQEAVTHLRRALVLLQELPDTPTRVQQELGLQLQLRVQLGRLQGEATPELKPVVERIQELSQSVEATPQLFWAFTGVYLFYLIREELQTAQALARQRIRLARRFPSPLFSMAAYTELGIASFFLGEPITAHKHLQRAIRLYDPQAPHPFFFDWEHGPPCFCYAAFAAWQLGYANRA